MSTPAITDPSKLLTGGLIRRSPAQQSVLQQFLYNQKFQNGHLLPNVCLLVAGQRSGKSFLLLEMAKNVIANYKLKTLPDSFRNLGILLSELEFQELAAIYLANPKQGSFVVPLNGEANITVHKLTDHDLSAETYNSGRFRGHTLIFAGISEVASHSPNLDLYVTVLMGFRTALIDFANMGLPVPGLVLVTSPTSYDDWAMKWLRGEKDPLVDRLWGLKYNLERAHMTSWELNSSAYANWQQPAQGVRNFEDFVRDYAAYKFNNC